MENGREKNSELEGNDREKREDEIKIKYYS